LIVVNAYGIASWSGILQLGLSCCLRCWYYCIVIEQPLRDVDVAKVMVFIEGNSNDIQRPICAMTGESDFAFLAGSFDWFFVLETNGVITVAME